MHRASAGPSLAVGVSFIGSGPSIPLNGIKPECQKLLPGKLFTLTVDLKRSR